MSELVNDPELTQAFTVVHRTQTFTAGRSPVFVDASSTVCRGVVVPASPAVLQELPEGTRLTDVLSIFSNAVVSTGNGVDNTVSDVIVFGGFRWLVYSETKWDAYGFSQILAVKNDRV